MQTLKLFFYNKRNRIWHDLTLELLKNYKWLSSHFRMMFLEKRGLIDVKWQIQDFQLFFPKQFFIEERVTRDPNYS